MPGTSQQNRREMRSLNLPEDLVSQLGHNAVLRRLIQEGVPLTAKNYIDMNWWGNPPSEIDEDEKMVIRSLRRYEAAQKNKRGKISERHSMGGHARGGSVDVYNPDEIDAIAAQIRGAI
jgi:hypothetical protein